MRVLLVSHLPRGGVDTYIKELTNGFNEHFIEYQCYFVNDSVNLKEDLNYSHIRNFNIPLATFMSIESDMGISEIEEDFRYFLQGNHFDVIDFQHLQHIGASLVNVAKEFNIPVAMTIHDYWTICPNIFLLNKNFESCSGPNKGLECVSCYNTSEQLLQERYNYFHEILLKKVDVIITVSQSVAAKLIEEGIPSSKIKVVYPKIRVANTDGETFNMEKIGKFKIGYLGTIAAIKGTHLFLKAFERLKHKNIEFHLYGNVKEFKEKVGILKNEENFYWHGSYKPEQLPILLKDIDCVVIPSIVPETGPLTVQEVLNNKIPVLGANIGGIPEYVNGNCGVLFEAGNIDDLVSKIEDLMENKKEFDFENETLNEADQFIENILKCYTELEQAQTIKVKKRDMYVNPMHIKYLAPNDKIFYERQMLNYSIPILDEVIRESDYRSIAIFGLGKNGKKLKRYFDELSIKLTCFIDNNPNNEGSKFEDIEVFSINRIIEQKIKLDLVIVVGDREKEMIQQFENLYNIKECTVFGLRSKYYESI